MLSTCRPVRRLLLLPLALAALASVGPGAMASDRCAARSGERVADRDPAHAVLVRQRTAADRDGLAVLLCDVRTGRRATVMRTTETDEQRRQILAGHVAGRYVAWLLLETDHFLTQTLTLTLYDATTRHRFPGPKIGDIAAWDLGSAGQIAWIGDARVQVWTRGGPSKVPGTRVVDRGVGLAGVRFTGTRIAWTHGGAARSVAREQPVGRCAGGPRSSPEIEVRTDRRGAPTLCWRATGRVTTLPRDAVVDDLAGPYAVVQAVDALVRYDVRDGTTWTVPTSDARHASVAPSGMLAWTQLDPDDDHRRDVWVADAAGRHIVGTTSGGGITLDGATVWWSPTESYTLVSP